MRYLYLITNKINGKQYVGITKDPKNRWYMHRWNSRQPWSKRSFAIANAMRKYGADNFEFQVIAMAKNLDIALNAEIELIKQYDTFNSGYNETKGGDVPFDRTGIAPWNKGMKTGPMSEDRKEQNRQYMLSNPNDGQFKEGKTAHNKGKSPSPEQIEKQRLQMKGRRVSIKSEFKKGQMPHNRISDSTREYIKNSNKTITELSIELGIHRKTIAYIRKE